MREQGYINLIQREVIMEMGRKVKAFDATCGIYERYGELTALLPLMRQNDVLEFKGALEVLRAVVDELACAVDDALGAIESSPE